MRNRSNSATMQLDTRSVITGLVFFLLVLASTPIAKCASGRIELNILAGVRMPDSTRIASDFVMDMKPWSFTDERKFKSIILRHRLVGFEVEKYSRPFPAVRNEQQFRFYQWPANSFVKPIKKLFKP